MEFTDIPGMLAAVRTSARVTREGVELQDPDGFRERLLDRLTATAVFAEEEGVRETARWIVWEGARSFGTFLASIQGYYAAKGQGRFPVATVPAINVRGMTYDIARAVYGVARRQEAGAVILEIAKSEIGYTFQRPAEYALVCLAGAVREGITGPVFAQGDHFQVNAKNWRSDPAREMESLRQLIVEAIAGGFYNIDIDSSTVVELGRPTVKEQQRDNYRIAAELTHFIRAHEPAGVTVSVGAEIGEVGGKNSTVEEFEAFMEGYLEELDRLRPGAAGISKISIQTGTSHGGTVLPDGSIADVAIDFKALEDISRVARRHYGLGGAVQHGASTLPDSAFDQFPRCGACEVHLATAYQNLVFDGGRMPQELKDKVYAWLARECAAERKAGDTDEQFYYKTRKKGWGPHRREFWYLSEEVRREIREDLAARFDNNFQKLGVRGTRPHILESVAEVRIRRAPPAAALAHL